MKLVWNWSAFSAIGIIILTACFEPPAFSVIPSIEYRSIIFKDIADPSLADSLILTLGFKDGDGDLGIDPSETHEPYNDKYYYAFTDATLTKSIPVSVLNPNFTYITYKTQRNNHNQHVNDTLPSFSNPANCLNWEIRTLNSKIDTFYFQINLHHYNIFVRYFIKNTDGSYKEFDWQKEFPYPNCGIPFHGRFPILSKDLSRKVPLDGTIRYGMTSTGFLILFSIKTLKLKVTIEDRLFHKSDTISTPDFTLLQIKQSG
jgi:hypothetical protein